MKSAGISSLVVYQRTTLHCVTSVLSMCRCSHVIRVKAIAFCFSATPSRCIVSAFPCGRSAWHDCIFYRHVMLCIYRVQKQGVHDHAYTICIGIGLRHATCNAPALDSQTEAVRRRKDSRLTSSFEAGNIRTNTKHITGTTKSTFNEAHVYLKVVHRERSM